MPNRFRKLTAWLGILAIWLVVVVPFVSQVAARAATPASQGMPICLAGHDNPHGMAHDAAHHALHFDACGYCSFFAHIPALYAVTPAATGSRAVHASVVTPVCQSAFAVRHYSRASPRAPPRNV